MQWSGGRDKRFTGQVWRFSVLAKISRLPGEIKANHVRSILLFELASWFKDIEKASADVVSVLIVVQRKRFTYDEKETTRARDRIHQALSRLAAEFQTMDSKLLYHVEPVVERTAVDVEDTKAGVERTAKGIELTKAGVEELHDRENVKIQNIERQGIIDWICPTEIDYLDQQNTLTSGREQGIGDWFVDTQEFRSWLHGNRITLLCSGEPGAGKSMTTSLVVSNILERYDNDDQIAIAYIYCQHTRRKEQTPKYLMSSILRQLLEQCDMIADEVRASYKSKKGKHTLSPHEIVDLLNAVLNTFKKTFIIIDALDELDETNLNELVPLVYALQQKSSINVYFTSRYREVLAQKAPGATQVDIRVREEDLRYCLNKELRRGSLLSEDPVNVKRAITKIMQASEGMYVSKIILEYRSWKLPLGVFSC